MSMKQIWKFPFNVSSEISIQIPKNAKILHIDCQKDIPCLWALVNPEREKEKCELFIYGTGHPIPLVNRLEHVGTFQAPPFVWHVFKKKNK